MRTLLLLKHISCWVNSLPTLPFSQASLLPFVPFVHTDISLLHLCHTYTHNFICPSKFWDSHVSKNTTYLSFCVWFNAFDIIVTSSTHFPTSDIPYFILFYGWRRILWCIYTILSVSIFLLLVNWFACAL